MTDPPWISATGLAAKANTTRDTSYAFIRTSVLSCKSETMKQLITHRPSPSPRAPPPAAAGRGAGSAAARGASTRRASRRRRSSASTAAAAARAAAVVQTCAALIKRAARGGCSARRSRCRPRLRRP